MNAGADPGRRRLLGLLGATLAAASCDGASRTGATGPPRAAATGDVRALPPVPEALWVAGGNGPLTAYDGRDGQVAARVETTTAAAGTSPGLYADGRRIWVHGILDGRIAVVDPRTARVTARASVPVASPPAAARTVTALGMLWIAHAGGLWRVSPSGKATRIGLPPGFRPGAMAAFRDRLWVTGSGTGRLAAVGAADAAASPAGTAPAGGIALLAAGRSGLFAAPGNSSRAWLLDPATGAAVATVSLSRGELIFDMIAAGPDMWVVGNEGTVAAVTGGRAPKVTRTVQVSDTSQTFPAAAGLGSLWVCDEVYGQLVRVDPGAGRVRARMEVPVTDPDDPAFGVLTGRHGVWLVDPGGALMRVDPAAGRVARLGTLSGRGGLSAVVAAPPRRPG